MRGFVDRAVTRRNHNELQHRMPAFVLMLSQLGFPTRAVCVESG